MPKDIEAKQKARQERNEAQAIEETAIWQDITAKAEHAVTLAKAKRGRPSSYRAEIADEIITRMAEGQSLNSICKLEHMPAIPTVYEWTEKHHDFSVKYARARELAAHTLFSAMKDIADDDSNDILPDGSANNAAIQRARLRVDTYARIAGKLASKSYGERSEVIPQTVNVTNNSLTIDGRSLGTEQRQNLRTMLLAAREQTVNET
jgi:hypothetical protein